MTVITIVLLIFGITGSEVTFIEGVIFWILFLIYLGYLFVMAKKGNNQEEAEAKDNPVWKCILLMVIGGILVVKGSDFAVSGATEIARYFGMSPGFPRWDGCGKGSRFRVGWECLFVPRFVRSSVRLYKPFLPLSD